MSRADRIIGQAYDVTTRIVDPETGLPYVYRAVWDGEEFALEADREQVVVSIASYEPVKEAA